MRPSPDECSDAVPIVDGETYFSTIGATTDGLPVEPDCQEAVDIVRDIWFMYEAKCTGVLTASTCNSATFNTRIAIYESCDPAACPPTNATLLACNDNATGCAGMSIVSAAVIEGQCYRIRVGGQGGSGIGLLSMSCAPGR